MKFEYQDILNQNGCIWICEEDEENHKTQLVKYINKYDAERIINYLNKIHLQLDDIRNYVKKILKTIEE